MDRKPVSATLLIVLAVSVGVIAVVCEVVNPDIYRILRGTTCRNVQFTGFTAVTSTAPIEVGLRAGDWISYNYTYGKVPLEFQTWIMIEVLNVQGTNVKISVTKPAIPSGLIKQTVTVDVAAGNGTLNTFAGSIIPTNCTVGDLVYISGFGKATIAGETTRAYAGENRTVVYTSFLWYEKNWSYYWDKQTGVIMEASFTPEETGEAAIVDMTNMWQNRQSGLPIDPIVFSALIIVAILIVVALFIRHRRNIHSE